MAVPMECDQKSSKIENKRLKYFCAHFLDKNFISVGILLLQVNQMIWQL